MSDNESTPRAAHESSDDERRSVRSKSSDSSSNSSKNPFRPGPASESLVLPQSIRQATAGTTFGAPMLSVKESNSFGGVGVDFQKKPSTSVPPPPPPAPPTADNDMGMGGPPAGVSLLPGMGMNGFPIGPPGTSPAPPGMGMKGAGKGVAPPPGMGSGMMGDMMGKGKGGHGTGPDDKLQGFQKIKDLDEAAAKYKDMPDHLVQDMIGSCGSMGSMLLEKGMAQPPPCVFFLRGVCKMGIRCKFQHNSQDAAQVQAQGMMMNPTPQMMAMMAGPRPGFHGTASAEVAKKGMFGPMSLAPPSKRMRPMQNSMPSWLIDEGEVGPSKYIAEWNIPPPLPPGRPGVMN